MRTWISCYHLYQSRDTQSKYYFVQYVFYFVIHRLDNQLRIYREGEWAAMRKDADELRRELPSYEIEELITTLEDFVSRLNSLAIEVSQDKT